jgi:hypothetical protein
MPRGKRDMTCQDERQSERGERGERRDWTETHFASVLALRLTDCDLVRAASAEKVDETW